MKKVHTSNLLLLIIVIFQLLISQIMSVMNIRMSVPMALLFSQLILLIPFAVWCVLKKKNLMKVIRLKKTKVINIFFAFLIAIMSYPVVIFLNMISMLFVDNAVSEIMPAVMEMGLLPGLFFMALLPAFVEETIFRGMLYNTYSQYRPGMGIILSAVLFGLMHMNFNQMPYAIYLGIIMAVMMEVCDSIIIPMVIHFTMNASSSIMVFLSQGIVQGTGETQTTDLKEALMESYVSTMEQMGMEFSQLQLDSMFPIYMTGILIGFAFVAVVSLALVFILIRAIAGINGRTLKEILPKQKADKKHALMDIWLLLFIIYTLYQCVAGAIG